MITRTVSTRPRRRNNTWLGTDTAAMEPVMPIRRLRQSTFKVWRCRLPRCRRLRRTSRAARVIYHLRGKCRYQERKPSTFGVSTELDLQAATATTLAARRLSDRRFYSVIAWTIGVLVVASFGKALPSW